MDRFQQIEDKIKKINYMKKIRANYNELSTKNDENIKKIDNSNFNNKFNEVNNKINEIKESLKKYNKNFKTKETNIIIDIDKEKLKENLIIKKNLQKNNTNYINLLKNFDKEKIIKPSIDLFRQNIKSELKLKRKLEQKIYKEKINNIKLY